MSQAPRVLHFSSVLGLGGANRAMITLLAGLARRGPTHVLFAADGEAADLARAHGAIVHTVYARGGWPWPRAPIQRWTRVARRLRTTLRELDVNLIHAHLSNAAKYWIPARMGRSVKVVVHCRDNYKGQRGLYHLGTGRADHIITVSEWIKRGLPPRLAAKATALLDACELPDVEPPVRSTGRTLSIGMAGAMAPKKGHDLFVEAALKVAARHPVQWHVWGLTPGNEYCDRLRVKVAAASPDVRGRFHLEDFRPDMESFYAAVDVVVVPSRFPEPLGRMMTESMARYKAVIAANHGGIPEVCRHEQTGLLFTPGDAVDLERQLERLIADGAMRERLAVAGRRAVERQLDPERYADAVCAIYQQVLAGNSRS